MDLRVLILIPDITLFDKSSIEEMLCLDFSSSEILLNRYSLKT